MREHDMRHLEWLRHVATADVQHLEMKEATYQGSWKRSGGRSAWFMLRRKIDRLLEMMKRPEPPPGFTVDDMMDCVDDGRPTDEVTVDKSVARYLTLSYTAENIFAMIRRDPSGSDGSVLAEVRDLRRYLLLVEAEMISRGVVESEKPFNTERRVPRFDPPGEPVPDPTPKVKLSFVEKEAFKGLAPWLVLKSKLSTAPETEQEGKALSTLYDDHGAGLMKLTPDLSESQLFDLSMMVNSNTSVASSMILEALKCYVKVDGTKTHVLDVHRAPQDYRSAWPHLHREYNATEFAALESWKRALYLYSDGETKWKLKEGQEAWMRESP